VPNAQCLRYRKRSRLTVDGSGPVAAGPV